MSLEAPLTADATLRSWRIGFDPREALLAHLVARVKRGRLHVVSPGGRTYSVGRAGDGEEATLFLHNWSAVFRLIAAGDIGFAQAVIAGECSSPDFVALIRLADRNIAELGAVGSTTGLSRWASRVVHWANANTRRGSARNIMAHYDLGNAFFAKWLDASMSYSSGIFTKSSDSLEVAQACKLARIGELLRLSGGEQILEIGCGWGALAGQLVDAGASQVTALTLSPAQAQYAQASLDKSGRGGQVEVALRDYRDSSGKFDRIVSIEMCEAVGEAFLAAYFRKIATSLKAGGRAVLQIITVADERLDSYRNSPDFIQRYVFPGGFLPSKALLHSHFAAAGLRLVEHDTFGLSYAHTLAQWRRRFHANWPEIAALGFDAQFRRLWDYYLAYCEAGFLAETVDVGLYALERA